MYKNLHSERLKYMIKAIMLDVDDTIFDFDKCSETALRETFKKKGFVYSDEIFKAYSKIDKMLWSQQSKGKLSVQEVMIKRFEILLGEQDIHMDAALLNEKYLENLSHTYELEKGIDKILPYLYEKYPLYVASNGKKMVQESRLNKAGFIHYFKDFFVSDEIGMEKPQKDFFEVCLKYMDIKAEEVLIIGDGLIPDITGGIGAGLVTCWYNRKNMERPNNITPQFEIENLMDLKKIV